MPTTLSDGKRTRQFSLNPERVSLSIVGDYAINSVLDTDAPQVRRKSSARVYKLDGVKLMSFGRTVDQLPIILSLQFWAAQQTKLRYTSETYSSASCYIKSLQIDIKEWRGKKVISAEASFELIEASTTNISPTTGSKTQTKTPAKKITPREQTKYRQQIESLLKVPSKQKTIGISGTSYKVEVSDNKKVTIRSAGKATTYDFDTLLKRLK